MAYNKCLRCSSGFLSAFAETLGGCFPPSGQEMPLICRPAASHVFLSVSSIVTLLIRQWHITIYLSSSDARICFKRKENAESRKKVKLSLRLPYLKNCSRWCVVRIPKLQPDRRFHLNCTPRFLLCRPLAQFLHKSVMEHPSSKLQNLNIRNAKSLQFHSPVPFSFRGGSWRREWEVNWTK